MFVCVCVVHACVRHCFYVCVCVCVSIYCISRLACFIIVYSRKEGSWGRSVVCADVILVPSVLYNYL